MLVFYLIGTKATKFKHDLKEKIDGDAGQSSVRGPHQVLACSGIAVILSLYHVYNYGEEKTIGKMFSYIVCQIYYIFKTFSFVISLYITIYDHERLSSVSKRVLYCSFNCCSLRNVSC